MDGFGRMASELDILDILDILDMYTMSKLGRTEPGKIFLRAGLSMQ